FFDKYQAGTRKCKYCGKYTNSPKAPKCKNPACGKDFPPLGSKEKAVKGATIQPVSGFVGLNDVLLKADKVKQFVSKQDGYEKAKKVVAEFETLLNDCGGIAQLKGAMITLEGWEKKEEKK
ncbi:MAG: hypothetical protein ACLP9L_36595, partial [Thermoguttaceae bacterium]